MENMNNELQELFIQMTAQQVYYDNGQLEYEWNYKNGKPHGLHREWYDNGQLMSEVTYENGEFHGLYRVWYDNGQLKWEENWKNGKLV